MNLLIENEYQDVLGHENPVASYEEIIERVVLASLDAENCPYECELSVLLTDDDAIHAINAEQRGIDRSTDVLSFPMIAFSAPSDFEGFDDRPDLFDPETGELLLGDIVISMDHVKAQAEAYGHSRERELAFLTAHSMLHLLGYDHMEDRERIVMEAKQEAILQSLSYLREET